MDELNGVINVYKEKDYTSHDVVAIIRKIFNRAKTGHTGTLDPMAEGVLPICIGKGTKLSSILTDKIKGYEATVVLGKQTDTGDFCGEVTNTCDVNLTKEEIINAVSTFKGEISQIPPMYSAIKINGQKLYDLARKGETVEREPRHITIYEIEIVKFLSDKEFVINVVCSKGTYIRTLCEDIGAKLNVYAHMGSLLRTKSGDFSIESSLKIDEIKKAVEEGRNVIMLIAEVLKKFPVFLANEENESFFRNGNKVSVFDESLVDGQLYLVKYCNLSVCGLFKYVGEEKVLKASIML